MRFFSPVVACRDEGRAPARHEAHTPGPHHPGTLGMGSATARRPWPLKAYSWVRPSFRGGVRDSWYCGRAQLEDGVTCGAPRWLARYSQRVPYRCFQDYGDNDPSGRPAERGPACGDGGARSRQRVARSSPGS